MDSFGENLRREREMRGISLQEICNATKIGVRMLDAIETGRLDRLPGGVFNRGFVRQYARYVGLDEDRVLADFAVALQNVPDQEKSKLPVLLLAGDSPSRNIPLLVLVSVVVLAALGAGGWRLLRSTETPAKAPAVRTQPKILAPASVLAPTPSVETPPSTNAATSAPDPNATLSLRLEAVDRCWISVSVDGRTAWKAPMNASSSRMVTAARTIQLEVDDAAALVVAVNGETQPPLGSKGEAKTVTYSKAGLEKKANRP
jgi:cytoskeletal protein RodZ